MKSCYYRKLDGLSLAVLDNCDYYGDGRIITRINVPKKYRGQGHGTALLKECIADADKEGITLWLEIAESGGLSYDELEAWYKRHGFTGHMIYMRRPR